MGSSKIVKCSTSADTVATAVISTVVLFGTRKFARASNVFQRDTGYTVDEGSNSSFMPIADEDNRPTEGVPGSTKRTH